MTRLTEIGNKHDTDKGTVAYEKHGYTEEYSKYIPEKGFYNLLEIGVWHGDSIKMWSEYNPDMFITGIDIDPNVKNYIDSRFNYEILIGNAAEKESVDLLLGDYDLDFIIDDGSHRYEDILASFKLLYPKLKSGGYYFIEDLHAGQSKGWEAVLEGIHNMYKWDTVNLKCNNKLLVIQK